MRPNVVGAAPAPSRKSFSLPLPRYTGHPPQLGPTYAPSLPQSQPREERQDREAHYYGNDTLWADRKGGLPFDRQMLLGPKSVNHVMENHNRPYMPSAIGHRHTERARLLDRRRSKVLQESVLEDTIGRLDVPLSVAEELNFLE